MKRLLQRSLLVVVLALGDAIPQEYSDADWLEAVVAEAGAMMFMEEGIEMETIFGDGSQKQSGFMGALLGAGKRLLTGESLFMTVFQNHSPRKSRVGFGAPYPGKIVAVNLAQLGGELICQKDSFLCAAKGVSVGIALQRKLGAGLFGGEGFTMQRLQGDGWAFVHAGGTLMEKVLAPGETLRVDTGCVVAYQNSVAFDIQYVGKVKTALFGAHDDIPAMLPTGGKACIRHAQKLIIIVAKSGTPSDFERLCHGSFSPRLATRTSYQV